MTAARVAGPANGGPLRVLLFSPLEGRDPPSGDTTYTRVLLDAPPPGVEYTSYADAIDRGQVVVRGRRRPQQWSDGRDPVIAGLRAVEQGLGDRLSYREPTWFVTIRPGAFDLLHSHLFAVRQVGPRVPVVSSAGFPLSVLYYHREGWSASRVRRADRVQLLQARLTGAHTPGCWAPPGERMTVYTEHYRDWLIARGRPPGQVGVLGQGLPDIECPPAPPAGENVTFGFVGRDFVRKGGPVALAAFELLRRELPGARMRLVTRSVPAPGALPDGVELVTGATGEQVVTRHLPDMHVLLAPTSADCGAPYGVLEALRAGRPVVLGRNPWLDPRLTSPGVRSVEATPSAVSHAALSLVADETTWQQASDGARLLFRAFFSIDVLHSALREAYSDAVRAAAS